VDVTVLHLIRHGESEWNAAGRLQGQADPVPLTARGRRQAEEAARELRSRDIAGLHSSDLLRAVQTAEVIGVALHLPVERDSGLREQSYGELEGLSSAQVLADAPYDFTDPDARAIGGESLRDVHERIGPRLEFYLERYAGRECVLVSHGDVIRAALAWLDGSEPGKGSWRDTPNGSVTSVRRAGVSRSPR
jgi:probable phosphoglycerate mutase